ncbi:hypothetical protein CDAR_591801 [Caerostris darwini]|uniref:Uncharacterized protein n=1 Tax=Caerostris darwini TaxID=1538125 RepID=A0AAV4PIB1_9ARAC|nr:hypothetical protein CDAR_591801 [Caerostris darwini]
MPLYQRTSRVQFIRVTINAFCLIETYKNEMKAARVIHRTFESPDDCKQFQHESHNCKQKPHCVKTAMEPPILNWISGTLQTKPEKGNFLYLIEKYHLSSQMSGNFVPQLWEIRLIRTCLAPFRLGE